MGKVSCGLQEEGMHNGGMAVERVSSIKFLGVHISDDLSWSTNTSSLVKKVHQRLFFLRIMKEEPPVFSYRGEALLVRN